MLLPFVVMDAVLLGLLLSLTVCVRRGDDVAYISEFILQCKRDAHTRVLPWLCVAAFAAVVLVQFRWMNAVAAASVRRSGTPLQQELWAAGGVKVARGAGVLFMCCAALAVAGFCCVVQFDWRETSDANIATHRAGVGGVCFGSFFALHLIWAQLRAADSIDRQRGSPVTAMPCCMWAEYDVLFVCVLAVFVVTSFVVTVEANASVSVFCEYAAFLMLFVQATWLLLACAEREHGRPIGEVAGTWLSFGDTLALLLAAYGVEALLVLVLAERGKRQ
jgi:hypothetical protein